MSKLGNATWELWVLRGSREKKGHHSPGFEVRQEFRPSPYSYSSTTQAPSTAHNTSELFTEMEV